MNKDKTVNIQEYRIKKHLNLGVIIFAAIIIYLLVTVFMYLCNPKVSIYEVREGSILRDTAYTGFIVREETIVHSKKSGYINYLVPETSKVGAKTKVYAVSDTELKFDEDEDKTDSLTMEEQSILLVKTQSFSEDYTDRQFADVYTLKTDILNTLNSKSSKNKTSQINKMNKKMGDALTVYRASDDGIIVYSTDGYENITVDKLTPDILNRKDYKPQNIADNTKIDDNTPIYKLITNDKWTIVINLDKTTAKELEEKKIS